MTTEHAREKILKAAGPVFAAKGFDAATVREICAAAEVNVASINYHFGDKQRLYVETVKFAKRERQAQVPLPDRPPTADPRLRLEDFIHVLLERMLGQTENGWASHLMMREVLEPTQACRELVDEFFRPQFQALMQCLAQIAPSASEAEQRKIGFSIIGQCLYYRVAGGVAEMLTPPNEYADQFGVAHLADHIYRFTLAAVENHRPVGASTNSNPLPS